MEQQIRFCTTSDGVRIAYAVMGEGPPLFLVPTWANSIERDADYEEGRGFKESIARAYQLITWDSRGIGMSQREVDEISAETQLADLQAVVEELGHRQFHLAACVAGTPVALAYAARHPERVSRLLLCGAYASPADTGAALEVVAAFADLLRDDWELALRAFGSLMFPSGPIDAQRWLSTLIRESASGEVAARYMAVGNDFDVTELVPLVTAPSLIIQSRKAKVVPIAAGQAVAALLPNARLVAVDGDAEHYYQGHQQWMGTVLKFLDEGREETSEAQPSETSALVTILFTDMEGSTALTQRLGDDQAQEVRHAHNDIVRSALSENGGSEIKHTGDGIMASFTTASAAHVEEHPDSPLGLYVGLNAGEPIAEERDLFGTSVDLAKRICDHARPGQILASNVVRELAAGKGFLFADIGEVIPKGFEEPVRLYEVRWREES